MATLIRRKQPLFRRFADVAGWSRKNQPNAQSEARANVLKKKRAHRSCFPNSYGFHSMRKESVSMSVLLSRSMASVSLSAIKGNFSCGIKLEA